MGYILKEKCIKKFKVAVEIADFICYVKYVNKKDEIPKGLVDDLYALFKNKKRITKKEIKQQISLHIHHLSPLMFKEKKLSLYYNPLTETVIPNKDKELLNTYDAPFVLIMNKNITKRYQKEEFLNHFTDLYHDSYYLLDIRYYGIEKKYYEVDFELCLNEKELMIKSSNPLYVDCLLKQYEMHEIIEGLGLSQEIDYKGTILQSENTTYHDLENVYLFEKETILEHLVDCYESSHFMFINNVFLKSMDISLNELIKPQDKPKLIVVLEENNHQYFEQHNNHEINRIENIHNNQILYVNEHLFRESNGSKTYILMMNDHYHIILNQLGSIYQNLPFIAKCQNKDVKLIHNLIDKYYDTKRINSYIDYLLYMTYILDEEALNHNLNYYLANTLKSTTKSIFRLNFDRRESLPYKDLKKLLKVEKLAKELNKAVKISIENQKLLLEDMENMIRTFDNLESIVEFSQVVDRVLKALKINMELYENQIIQIQTLINLKKIILTKEEVNFILDTSVLMDEPDVFHKYFSDKQIIVHSIIKNELERHRANNINAVRAIRNINLLKNDDNKNLQFIQNEEKASELTKPQKLQVFEELIDHFYHLGKQSVVVSNDMSKDLYDKNKNHMIRLKHVPLLFK